MEINLECSAIINEDYSQFFDANSQICLNEDDAFSLQNNSLLQTQNVQDIQNFQSTENRQQHSNRESPSHSQVNNQSPKKLEIFNISSISQNQSKLSATVQAKQSPKLERGGVNSINQRKEANSRQEQVRGIPEVSEIHPQNDQSASLLSIQSQNQKQKQLSSFPKTNSIQSIHMRTGSVAYEQKHVDEKSKFQVEQTSSVIQKPLTQASKKQNIFQKLNAGWTQKPTQNKNMEAQLPTDKNIAPDIKISQEIQQSFNSKERVKQNKQGTSEKFITHDPKLDIKVTETSMSIKQNELLKQKEQDEFKCMDNQFDPFNLSEIQPGINDNQSELMISRYLDQTHQSPIEPDEIGNQSQQLQVHDTNRDNFQEEHNLSPIKIQSYFSKDVQQNQVWKDQDFAVFREMKASQNSIQGESHPLKIEQIQLSMICGDNDNGDNQIGNGFNELSSILDLNVVQSNQEEGRSKFESQHPQQNANEQQEGKVNLVRMESEPMINRSTLLQLSHHHQQEEEKVNFESWRNQELRQSQNSKPPLITQPPVSQIFVEESTALQKSQANEQTAANKNIAAPNSNTAWQKVTFTKRRSSNNIAASQNQQIQKQSQTPSVTSKILQKQQSMNEKQNQIISFEDAKVALNDDQDQIRPTFEMIKGLTGALPDTKTVKPIKKKKSNDILPVFDCLFCCQEHFVLNKINERSLILKYATHLKYFIAQRDMLTINWLIFKILPSESKEIELIQFSCNQMSSSNLKAIENFKMQAQSQAQNAQTKDKFNSGFVGFNELKSVLVKNVNQEFDTKVARLLLEVDLLERQNSSENERQVTKSQIKTQSASKLLLKDILSKANEKRSKKEQEREDGLSTQRKDDEYKSPQSIKLMFLLQHVKKEQEKNKARTALLGQNNEAENIKKQQQKGVSANIFGDLSGAESMIMDGNDQSNFLIGNLRTRRQRIIQKISFESEVFNIYESYDSTRSNKKSINLEDTESEESSEENEEELTDGEEEEEEEYEDEQEEYSNEQKSEESIENEEYVADESNEDEEEVDSQLIQEENSSGEYVDESSMEIEDEEEFKEQLDLMGNGTEDGNMQITEPEDEDMSDREMLNHLQIVKGISQQINSNNDQEELEEDVSEIREIVKVYNQKEDSFKHRKPPQSPNQVLKTHFQQSKRTSSSFKPLSQQNERAQISQNTLSQNMSNNSQQNICGLSSIDQLADEDQEFTQVPLKYDIEEQKEDRGFKNYSDTGNRRQQKRQTHEFSGDVIQNNESISHIKGDEMHFINNDSLSQNGLGYIGIGTGITSISNINQTNDEQLMRKQSALSSGHGGNLIIQENFMVRDNFERMPQIYQMNLEDDELMEDEDSERYTFGYVTPKEENMNMLSGDLGDLQQRVTFSHNNGESSLSPVRATTNATLILHNTHLIPFPVQKNKERQSHHPRLHIRPQRVQVQEEYYDFNQKQESSNKNQGQSQSLSNSSQTQNPLYLDISPVSCHQKKEGNYVGDTLKLNFNHDSISQDQQQFVSQVSQSDPIHQRQNSLGKDEEEVLNTLRNRFDFYPALQEQDSLDIQLISNLPNQIAFEKQKEGKIDNSKEGKVLIMKKKLKNKILSQEGVDDDQRYQPPFMRPSQYSYDQQQLMLSSSIHFNQDSLDGNFKIGSVPEQGFMKFQNQQISQQLKFSNNPSGFNQLAQPSEILNLNSITDASQTNLCNDLTQLSQTQQQLLDDRGQQSKSFTATRVSQKLNHQRVLPQNQLKLKLTQQQQKKLQVKQYDNFTNNQKHSSGINKNKQALTEAQITPQTIRNAAMGLQNHQDYHRFKMTNESLEPVDDRHQYKSRKDLAGIDQLNKLATSSNSKKIKPKKKQVVRQSVNPHHLVSFDSRIKEDNVYGEPKASNKGEKTYQNQNHQLSKNTASSIEYAEDLLMLQQMTQTLNKNQRMEENKKAKKTVNSQKQGGNGQLQSQKLVRKESTQAICTPIDTNDAVYFNSNNVNRNQYANHPFSVKTSIAANTTSHQNGRRQNKSNLGGCIQESSKLMFQGNTCKNGTNSQANLLIMADILPQANNQLYTNRKFNNDFYSTKNMTTSEKRPLQMNKDQDNSRKTASKNKHQIENNYNQIGAVTKGSSSKNTSSKTLQQVTQSPVSLTKTNKQGFFNNILNGGSQSNANHLLAAANMPQTNLNLIPHMPITKKDFNMYMKNQILSSRYATTAGTTNLPFNNLIKQAKDANGNLIGIQGDGAIMEIKTSQTQTKKKRRSNKFQGSTKASNLVGVFNQEGREGSFNPVGQFVQGAQHAHSMQSTTNSKGIHHFQDFASTISSGGVLATSGSIHGKRNSKGGNTKVTASKKSNKKDKQAGKKVDTHLVQQQQLQQDYYQQQSLIEQSQLQQQYQSYVNNMACNSMNFSNDYSLPSIMGGLGGISNIFPSANQHLDNTQPPLSKQQSLSINNSRHIGQHQNSTNQRQKHHTKQSSQNEVQYLSMQDQNNMLGSLQFQGANNFSQINQMSSIGGVNSSQGNTLLQPQLLMDQSSSNLNAGNNFFGQSTLIQAEMSTTCISNGNNGTINHTTLNPQSKAKLNLTKQNQSKQNQMLIQNDLGHEDSHSVNQTLPLQRKQPLISKNKNEGIKEPTNFNTLSFTHPDDTNSNLISEQLINPQMTLLSTLQQVQRKNGILSQNNQSLNLSSTNQSHNNTNLSNVTATAAVHKKSKKKQMLVDQVLQKQNSLQQQQMQLQKQIQQAALINQNRANLGENQTGLPQSYFNNQSKIDIQQRANNSIEEVSLFKLLKGLGGDPNSHFSKNKKEFNMTANGQFGMTQHNQPAVSLSIENKEDLLAKINGSGVGLAKKQPKIKAEAVKKNNHILNQVRQQSNQSVRSNSITNGNALTASNWQSNYISKKNGATYTQSSVLNSQSVQAASLERNSQGPVLMKHGSANEAQTGYQLSFVNKVGPVSKGPHSSQFSFSQQKNTAELGGFGPPHILQSMDAIEKQGASEQLIRNQAFTQTVQILNQNARVQNQNSLHNNQSSVASTVKNSSLQPLRKNAVSEKRTRSTSKSQGQVATISNQDKVLASNPSVKTLELLQTLPGCNYQNHSQQSSEVIASNLNTVKHQVPSKQFILNQQHILNQCQMPQSQIINHVQNQSRKVSNKQQLNLNSSNNLNLGQTSKQGSIKTSFVSGGGIKNSQASLPQNQMTSEQSNQLLSKNQLESLVSKITIAAGNSSSVTQSLDIQSQGKGNQSVKKENPSLTRQEQQQKLDTIKLKNVVAVDQKKYIKGANIQLEQSANKVTKDTLAGNSKKKQPQINQVLNLNIGSGNLAFQSELNKLYGTGKVMMSQVTSPLRSIMNASVQGQNNQGTMFQQPYSQMMSFSHIPNERRQQ